MSELAERSGVSAGTIKHYLREGLLGAATTSCALAQHGLLPAGVRRADPHDQAPAGGALHAAAADQGAARASRRRPRTARRAPRRAERYAMPANVLDRLGDRRAHADAAATTPTT
jgi:hypothetical protein